MGKLAEALAELRRHYFCGRCGNRMMVLRKWPGGRELYCQSTPAQRQQMQPLALCVCQEKAP